MNPRRNGQADHPDDVPLGDICTAADAYCTTAAIASVASSALPKRGKRPATDATEATDAVDAVVQRESRDIDDRGLRRILAFARRLKAKNWNGVEFERLLEVVRPWYLATWPMAEDRPPWAAVLDEVARTLGCVRHEAGECPIDEVVRQAAMLDPPKGVKAINDDTLTKLANVCLVLQRRAGQGKTWFLGQEAIAESLGVERCAVTRRLSLLCRLKVIKLVRRGVRYDPERKAGRASEYLYLLPLGTPRLSDNPGPYRERFLK